jgi:uncharacterized protein
VRWIGVVLIGAALVVVAGCGSSSEQGGQDTVTPTATATATPTGAEADLDRLPEVPEATTSTRPPASVDGTGGSAFLTAVFDDVQAMWRREFDAAGVDYAPARITIFRDQVDTACGTQSANVGPFYCPADAGVYLDLRFFDVLSRRVGVRLGDFAQAYVVAHEVAHHVQTLLGITQRLAVADQQDAAGANARSVRFELQADCLAGIWGHYTEQKGILEKGDLEDALNAAQQIGDDTLQKRMQGYVVPESFNHGTSAQRTKWFKRGFDSGRLGDCDTFNNPV